MIWVAGKDNLAAKLSKSLMLTAVDRELAAMKSGRDQFSRLRKPGLIEAVGDDAWTHIASKFEKEKYQLSAARWLLRGLPIEKAIRKVEVDREIGHDFNNFYRALDD
jgi:hypothetical protein